MLELEINERLLSLDRRLSKLEELESSRIKLRQAIADAQAGETPLPPGRLGFWIPPEEIAAVTELADLVRLASDYLPGGAPIRVSWHVRAENVLALPFVKRALEK